MDEPESMGALSIAAREKLDNLIFVINCNLQRLDGPVRGNGKIIQEFEGVFRGAGWNVIKVIWGSRWDALFAKDTQGILEQRMENVSMVNIKIIKLKMVLISANIFLANTPELKAMVADMTDEEIWHLNRGGHDSTKSICRLSCGSDSSRQATVILAKTVKGYGMGAAGEGLNITHQQKKMTTEDLIAFPRSI